MKYLLAGILVSLLMLSSQAYAGTGATDGAEATKAGADAGTDGAEATKAGADGADTAEATDTADAGTDGADTAEATDTADAADATKAGADATDSAESTEAADTADAGTDGAEATKAGADTAESTDAGTDVASPRKQVMQGAEPSEVECAQGLTMVLKFSTGHPACVKPASVEVLIERGWAVHFLPEPAEENNIEIFATGMLDVDTSNVAYFQDATGYLAEPAEEGEYPAVIMIHEWWGLNDNIKDMAETLASHGYTVLAVDMYDGQVATTADEARSLMGSFEQEYWTENMDAAASYLQTNHAPERMGSIGWCFGGAQSLNLALGNDDMDATVIYYGNVVTDPEALSSIDWPILGIFAELDQGIPPSQVKEFGDALDEAGVAHEIQIYDGVDHAFANPSGERYAPEKAMDAWQRTLDFLDENLRQAHTRV